MAKKRADKVQKLTNDIKSKEKDSKKCEVTNIIHTRSKTNAIDSRSTQSNKSYKKLSSIRVEDKNEEKLKNGACLASTIILTRSKTTTKTNSCDQDTKIEIEEKISNKCVFDATPTMILTRSKSNTVNAQSTRNNKTNQNQTKTENKTCVATKLTVTKSSKKKRKCHDLEKLVNFKHGEIVLGRMRGYCYWPAKVMNDNLI